jgi:hypothetical protein
MDVVVIEQIGYAGRGKFALERVAVAVIAEDAERDDVDAECAQVRRDGAGCTGKRMSLPLRPLPCSFQSFAGSKPVRGSYGLTRTSLLSSVRATSVCQDLAKP